MQLTVQRVRLLNLSAASTQLIMIFHGDFKNHLTSVNQLNLILPQQETQAVLFCEQSSTTCNIAWAVLPGSVLGLLHFILYATDLIRYCSCQLSKSPLWMVLGVYLSSLGNNSPCSAGRLIKGIDKISNWRKSNQLKLKGDKTQLHDSIVMALPWDSISYIYIFYIYNSSSVC